MLAWILPASAIDSDHYLAGLGLHEETGRQIYLGGLYLPNEIARPADVSKVAGARIMEYRVVARRTSIRSLLGGILLQSEIATGSPPGPGTSELANIILSTVQSSLYAGDSFAIATDGSSRTSAILNGTVLGTVDDPAVADYLFKGWVSENGPTTAFRSSLMAESIDPNLRSILEANTASEERRNEVASWVDAEEEEAAEEVAAAPEPEPEPAPAEKAAPAAAVAAAAPAASAPAPTPAPKAAPEPKVAETPKPAPEPAPKATPAPAPEPAPVAEEPVVADTAMDDIMMMDVQEYSRRLAEFHGGMVAKVYRQIKYPKRAVRRNLQGRLEMDLSLSTEGSFDSVAISQSSGHKLLDEAALEAAERAFAGKPVEVDSVAMAEFAADENTLVIPIPVSFKLAD